MSAARSATLDFDNWLIKLPETQKSAFQRQLELAPDKEQERRKLQNILWIGERAQVPFGEVARNYDAALAGYATRAGWGDVYKDDLSFNARVTSEAAAERDEETLLQGIQGDTEEAVAAWENSMYSRAYWSAAEEKESKGALDQTVDIVGDFLKWQEAAKGSPAYRAQNAGKYWEQWARIYSQGRQDREAAAAAASEALPLLRTAADPGGASMDAVLRVLQPLTPQQRRLAIMQMQTLEGQNTAGAAVDSLNTGEAMVVGAGRMLSNIAEDYTKRGDRAALTGLKFQEGDKVKPEQVGNAAAVLQSRRIQQAGRSGGISEPGGGLVGAFLDAQDNTATLTKEQADAMNQQVSEMLTMQELAQELRDYSQRDLEGLKKESVFRTAMVGAAESVAAMATAALPGGIGFNALLGSYTYNAELDLVQKGVPRDSASRMAPVIGAAQAGIDRLQLSILKKLPGVQSVLTRLAPNALAMAAARTGWVTVAETLTEFAQDSGVPAIVQNVAAAVDEDVPAVRFSQVLDEVWAAAPETFFTMLPLALVGAGAASFRDIKEFRQLAADSTALQSLGFSPEQIAAIQLPDTDKESAAVLRSLWSQRKPVKQSPQPTTGPQSVAAASTLDGIAPAAAPVETPAVLAGTAETMEAVVTETALNQEAGIRELRRDDAGWYIVTEKGDRINTGTVQAAQAMRQVMAQKMTQEEAAAAVAEVEALAAQNLSRGEGTNVTFTGESRRAKMDAAGNVTAIRTRAGKSEVLQMSPVTLENLRAEMRALGMSEAVMRGSNYFVREDTGRLIRNIELNADAGLETIIHERFESLIRSGEVSSLLLFQGANQLTVLPQFDPAKVKNPGMKKVAESLRRIALDDPDVSEAERRETMVEIAVADYIGRFKDGTALEAGSIQAAVRAAALAAAPKSAARRALQSLAGMLAVVRRYLGVMFRVAAGIREARESGALQPGEAWDTIMDKLLGTDQQAAHEKAVLAEVEAMQAGQDTDTRAAVAEQGEGYKRTQLPDGATLEGPATFSIRAFHGTPHKVDRFSLEKIGTGEGAQAYGWGLYFAESQAVGEQYQTNLSQWSVPNPETEAGYRALGLLTEQRKYGRVDQEARTKAKASIGVEIRDGVIPNDARLIADIEKQIDGATGGSGNLYTVELLPDVEDFLDWDKPLSEQSEKVRAALAQSDARTILGFEGGLTMTGKDAYDYAAAQRGPDGASRNLAKLGIPGIRYLDGNSRDGGSGTYNYVIFDDKLVRILEENGRPVEQGETFSLASARTLEEAAAKLDAVPKKPEQRLQAMQKGAENLRGIQRVWLFNDGQEEPFYTTQAAVERQRRAMRKAREAELLQQVEDDFGDMEEVKTLASPTNSPLLAELFTQSPGDAFPRSRIARKPADYEGGEYDGAAELPAWLFGGNSKPDKLAQELYEAGLIREPSPDALWQGIEKALKTSQTMKDRLAKYRQRRAEAKQQAREESQEWAEAQNTGKAFTQEQRQEVTRSLVALDAILMTAPPEIRGKVGGFVKLSKLTTDKARTRFLIGRVEKMLGIYEQWLRKEYTDKLTKLIERVNDTAKPGEKARGIIGPEAHRFFAAVGEVVGMTAAQVEAKQAELENELTRPREEGEADLTDEEAANIFEKQQVLDIFGNLKDKNAADLSKAYEAALDVYKAGRNRWRIIEEARLAEVRAIGDAMIETWGGGGYKAIQGAKAKARSLKAKVNAKRLELKNFSGFLRAILGQDSELAAKWANAARNAMQFTETARRKLRDEWKSIVETATGKKGRAARLEVWDMVQNQSIDVVLAGAARTTTRSVPESILESIMDGTIDPRDVGLTRAQADALIAQDAGKPLEVKETSRGPSENIKLSEAEGIFITMLAAQEQYEKGLDAAGFTGDAVAEIEAALSPAAKQLRAWMRGKYAENYTALNAVFSRMFGVDLAQIENYAPAAFYHTGDANARGPEDSTMPEGGFRSNFLKTRKKHKAAPRLENAFATFFGHAAQSAHWQGFAELMREIRGVMARPDVKMALEGRHGREVAGLMSDWIKNLEGNGISRAHGAWDAFTGWLLRQAAYVHLAYNAGTLAVQSTAALGAAWKIGGGAFMRGLGKLIVGKLDARAMWQSDLIQNRLANGYAPEVRAALNDLWSAKPSRRQDFLEKGMEFIGFVDAFWTTASATIAWDAHYRDALAGGLSKESAEAVAWARTTETVNETAQPSTVTEKSLFEAKQGNLAKLAFLYASEARQKTALLIDAWKQTLTGKATKQDIQVLILAHLVIGPMIQVIRAAIRDSKDDDDDEVFDKKFWQNPWEWVRATALGPLNGVPLVGDLFSGFTSENAAVGRYKEAGQSALALMKGPEKNTSEKGEWYWNRVIKVLKGLDAATATGAGIADQVFKTADNFSGSDNESSR